MLAVISNALELVRRRVENEDELAGKYIGLAKGGITRASQLTQRLLAFSRQQPLHPGPVSVNELVNGLAPLLKHSLGGTIVFDTALADDAWLTYVDPNQLENVVLNLVVNARDAMEEGGRLTIETRNCALDEYEGVGMADLVPGSYVAMAIRDTGTGMTPEVMAKAFDPFFTTKAVGHGTGLGLSQVYGFVRQSGGQVKIDSTPGRGTVVELYLPRHTGKVEGAVVEAARAQIVPGKLEAILVTDDEASVRLLLGEMLTHLGYRVFAAEGGAAALQMLDEHPEIKLVVTDVLMPEMNGRELVDQALKRRPDLKVLFTTGYAGNVALDNRMNEQSIHILMKPFAIEELSFRIRTLLDTSEQQVH
jgi:CheY-like chemotaxis protein